MENQELILLENVDQSIESQVGIIKINNKDKIISTLQILTNKYQNLIVTEDMIKSAKEDRAFLNKISTSLDNKRKEIQKPHKEMLDHFKLEVDDFIKIINQLVLNIDVQVKNFEHQKANEKMTQVQDLIKTLCNQHGFSDFIDLITFDQKWLNATKSMTQIQSEIESLISKIKTEQELKEVKLTSRKNLVLALNAEFHYNYNPENFSIENFTDEDVRNTYERQKSFDERKKQEISIAANPEKITDIPSNVSLEVKKETTPEISNRWNFKINVDVDVSKISPQELKALTDIIDFIKRKQFGSIEIIQGYQK